MKKSSILISVTLIILILNALAVYSKECQNLAEEADIIVIGNAGGVSYNYPNDAEYGVSVDEVLKGRWDGEYVQIKLSDTEARALQYLPHPWRVKVYLKQVSEKLFSLVCGESGVERLGKAIYPPPEKVEKPEIPQEFFDEWETFAKEYDAIDRYGKPEIYWDFKANAPDIITLGDYTTVSQDSYEDRAREFLEKNKALLRIESSNIKLDRTKKVRGGEQTNLFFRQTYNNLPVFNTKVQVMFWTIAGSSKDEIHMLFIDYHPEIDIPTKPSISQKEAEKIALSASTLDKSKVQIESELGIYPEEKTDSYNYHLAYYVSVFSKDNQITGRTFGPGKPQTKEEYLSGPGIFIIDANDGKIIFKYDQVATAGEFDSSLKTEDNIQSDIVSTSPYYIIGILAAIILIVALFLFKKKSQGPPTHS